MGAEEGVTRQSGQQHWPFAEGGGRKSREEASCTAAVSKHGFVIGGCDPTLLAKDIAGEVCSIRKQTLVCLTQDCSFKNKAHAHISRKIVSYGLKVHLYFLRAADFFPWPVAPWLPGQEGTSPCYQSLYNPYPDNPDPSMSGPTGEYFGAKRGARAHSQCNGWCLEHCGHSCSFHQVRVRAESGRVRFLNVHVIPALRVLGSRPMHGCRCICHKGAKTKKRFFTSRNFSLLFSQRKLDKHV